MTRAEWEALVEYTLNIGRQMMEWRGGLAGGEYHGQDFSGL